MTKPENNTHLPRDFEPLRVAFVVGTTLLVLLIQLI